MVITGMELNKQKYRIKYKKFGKGENKHVRRIIV